MSLELKRSYQRNLGLSVILAGLFYITLMVGILLFIKFQGTTDEPSLRTITIASLIRPPLIIIEDSPVEHLGAGGKPAPVLKAQSVDVRIGKPYRGEVYPTLIFDQGVDGAAGSNENGWVKIISPKGNVEVLGLPRCRHVVIPEYPKSAKKDSVEAEVWVEIKINPEGKIIKIYAKESVAGYDFAKAVVKAVEQWEYCPGTNSLAVRSGFIMEFRLKS